ncbi:MAG: zinc ribbon domain-containing protein, partial [Actinomycetota bacterium]|nr:zinc ribbon domain-containing protein [Actinomycetota bacterium]
MTAEIFGPELLILVVVVAFIYLTIGGAIRAFRNNDVGWGIAIIAGWIFGLGWLIGAIYLATHRKQMASWHATRPCPECAETIKAAARRCRYCGQPIESPTLTADTDALDKLAEQGLHPSTQRTAPVVVGRGTPESDPSFRRVYRRKPKPGFASDSPDPTRRHQLRYFDGDDWTDHVS